MLVILNPTAGAGKARKWQDRIEAEFLRRGIEQVRLHVTAGQMDARSAAYHAACHGETSIVAIGGDGTINEVLNGLMASGRATDLTLGVINSGTGQGFAKGLQLPSAHHEQLDIIAGGTSNSVDICRIECHSGQDGSRITRYFGNDCQIGFGADVVLRTQGAYKRLGGTLGFGLAALSLLARRTRHPLRIHTSADVTERTYLGLTIANGPLAGGSMRLAPHATMHDGQFDVVTFHEMPLTQKLSTFSRIYSGKHITLPHVGYFQTEQLSIIPTASTSTGIAVDGEFIGYAPCTISIVPAALRIFTRHNK